MDMCSGKVLKKMLLFTLPLMCSSILQLLFNAVDIVVVGRFAGDESLAAVGSNTAIINLLTNLFVGLSVGANVTSAICYGAKKWTDLKKTVHTAMLLSIYSGLLLTAVGVIGARQILIKMQTPPEILDLASLYLRIYFLGMTPMMIYNFGSAILRSVGDTRRPLVYLLVSGAVNAVLNLFFVIVLRMDVAGVALATVISETISAVLIVRCMMTESEDSGIRLNIRELRIDRDKFIRILRIGLPAGFQGLIFSASNVVRQSSVNLFGKTVVAGSSASSNIEGFVYMAMNSFYQATLSFTSQNIGAGKIERVGRILRSGQLCVIVTGVVLGGGAALFGRVLLGIYTTSPAVIEAGMQRLVIIGCTYALCGIMDVLVGSLRGMGYSVMPMIVSLVGVCGIRLVWLFAVFWSEGMTIFGVNLYQSLAQFRTPESIYITYPVSWIITIAAHIVCYIIVKRKTEKHFAALRMCS